MVSGLPPFLEKLQLVVNFHYYLVRNMYPNSKIYNSLLMNICRKRVRTMVILADPRQDFRGIIFLYLPVYYTGLAGNQIFEYVDSFAMFYNQIVLWDYQYMYLVHFEDMNIIIYNCTALVYIYICMNVKVFESFSVKTIFSVVFWLFSLKSP